MKKTTILLLSLSFLTSLLTVAQQPAQFNWVSSIGDFAQDVSTGIATDASGNVYTVGFYQGTVDFDPGPGTHIITSAGGFSKDIYIQKLDAGGNFVWAHSYGTNIATDRATGITVDNNGDVIVVGTFRDTLDFDYSTNTYLLNNEGVNDGFILKLDAAGNFLWATNIGGAQYDEVFSVTTDNDNNLYLLGNNQTMADVDPGSGVVNLPSGNYLLKLDANGNYISSRLLDEYDVYDIRIDQLGNQYLVGEFSGTTDFDPGSGVFNLTAIGGDDCYVLKLDSLDNFIWARKFGGNGASTEVLSLALTQNAEVYTVGHFSENVDFDPSAAVFNINTNGQQDVFIQKLDSSGNFVWARAIGGIEDERSRSVALDVNENPYVFCSFDDTVDFDPGTGMFTLASVSSNGMHDAGLLKLDSNGNFLWALQFGVGFDDYEQSITTNQLGDIYLSGTLRADTVDFDPDTSVSYIPNNGNSDAYTVKLKDCYETMDSVVVMACIDYTVPSGNMTYNTSGIYRDTIANFMGCDSLITINLTINVVDTSVSLNGFTLSSNAGGASYQWIEDCGNGNLVIPGETNQNFTATSNGNYAVVVTQNGCTDTSNCYTITGVGINDGHASEEGFAIYPNPTTGYFTISSNPLQKNTPINIRVENMFGQVVLQQNGNSESRSQQLDLSPYVNGIYLVRIETTESTQIIRVIKQ